MGKYTRPAEMVKRITPSSGDLGSIERMISILKKQAKKARHAQIIAEKQGDFSHLDTSDLSLSDQELFRTIYWVHRKEENAMYPDQLVIGYSAKFIKKNLLKCVVMDGFIENIADIIGEFAATKMFILLTPQNIQFMDPARTWSNRRRSVTIFAGSGVTRRAVELQKAMDTFTLLRQIDDLRKILAKFHFKTFAPLPMPDSEMSSKAIEEAELEATRRGFRKRKIDWEKEKNLKRRKTVRCDVCVAKRVPIESWNTHFCSKLHYQNLFKTNLKSDMNS